MYAIVDIAGQQFKVEKDQELIVHRLPNEAGANVEFDKVLLTDDDGNVSVGKPYVEGMMVAAKVIEHLKGDKVSVFKKKRRKGYQKLNGHRQYLSKILIEDITAGEKKKETAKAEEPVKEKKAEPEDKKEKKETTPKAKAVATSDTKKAPKVEEPKKPEVKKEAKAKPEEKAVKDEKPAESTGEKGADPAGKSEDKKK